MTIDYVGQKVIVRSVNAWKSGVSSQLHSLSQLISHFCGEYLKFCFRHQTNETIVTLHPLRHAVWGQVFENTHRSELFQLIYHLCQASHHLESSQSYHYNTFVVSKLISHIYRTSAIRTNNWPLCLCRGFSWFQS